MANRPDTKLRVLRVLKILLDKTDEDRAISTPEIIQELLGDEEHPIEADRKSIYRDLEALRAAGFEIETRRTPYMAYALKSRILDPGQLNLVVNAVQSSPFITDAITGELVEHLGNLASAGQREAIREHVTVPIRVKTKNEKVFENLGTIKKAISEERQVCFQYLSYDASKKQTPKRGGRIYQVTPVNLLYVDGFYYLRAYSEDHEGALVPYRVDRMAEVEVSLAPRRKNDLISSYDERNEEYIAFGMFDKEEATITLELADPDAMDIVIDVLGPDVEAGTYKSADGGSSIQVRTKIKVTPQFYGWLFSVRDRIKLVKPDWLVKKHRRKLAEAFEESDDETPPDKTRRHTLGQYSTPPETAELAVSMFSDLYDGQTAECLDMGAGEGALTKALHERYGERIVRIDAVEIDSELAAIYDGEMSSLGIPHVVTIGDALLYTPGRSWSRAILNPPYGKLSAGDPRQEALPVRSANLYSAFLSVALDHLGDDGECVAIVPRSWMSGELFAPFRKWALSSYSLDAIHVYGSRTEVFGRYGVLQEIVIVRFSKRPQVETIRVTHSDGRGDDVAVAEYPAQQLIVGDDMAVRIAPSDNPGAATVESRGWCPSTGKVVDFRSADRIYSTYEDALADADDPSNIHPLVYTGNFRTGELSHPAGIGKPQWFRADDRKSSSQLIQPGNYVIARRVSSKEEPRRVVAYPVEMLEPFALGNHVNFVHAGTPRKIEPMPSPELARGLAMWLNTTYIDSWFRNVSGSTQVNARDIKAMPCPPDDDLIKIGKLWRPNMGQCEVDAAAEGIGLPAG